MYRYECHICHGLYDPGDLRNGVCDDCREADKQAENKHTEMCRLLYEEFKQMELEDMIYAN